MKTSSQNKREWQRIGLMGFLFLLLIVCFPTAFAGNLNKNSLETSSLSKNNKEKAFSYKILGDHHVSKGDFENAAIHYLKALEIGRNYFSKEEKIEMAKYIAWGEKLEEAAEELKRILAQDPENSKARILYARTLSWAGKLDEAIKEVAPILTKSPEEREALLVKADSLHWKGDYRKAIHLYRKLLKKEEAFDARLGLTYALLLSGDTKGAEGSRWLLRPELPYQEQELKKLDEAMKGKTEPSPVMIPKDKEAKALSDKEIGDDYVTKGDFEKAALHYLKALEAGRNQFSKDERIEMAKYIAWGEKPEEATEELKRILAEDPENSKARTLYARTLSWAGKLDEAIKEADTILSKSPEDRVALQIKADALRWKGSYKKAIRLYKKLLQKDETFGARLGLTYALLFSRNKKEAKESRKLLKPKFPYQEQEIEKLNRAIEERTQSKLEPKSSYYRDSENNRVLRSWLSYEYWAGKWKLNIYFRHTEARDNTRRARAEDFSFNMYSKFTDSFAMEGRLGFTQFGQGRAKNYLTGQIKAGLSLRNGSLGAYVQRDSFTYTAQLIDSNIMVTRSSLNISQGLSRRLYLYTSYNYGNYSDKNNSHDFLFSLSYAFLIKIPSLNSGYQFRYLDFRHHSGHGGRLRHFPLQAK